MKAKDKLDAETAIKALELSADAIMRIDGDRDHINQSNLVCEHTQTAARLMREVATFLKEIRH